MAEPITLTLEQSARAIESTKARTKREIAAVLEAMAEECDGTPDGLLHLRKRVAAYAVMLREGAPSNREREARFERIATAIAQAEHVDLARPLSEDERAIEAEAGLSQPLADNDPGDGLPAIRERDDFEEGMRLAMQRLR